MSKLKKLFRGSKLFKLSTGRKEEEVRPKEVLNSDSVKETSNTRIFLINRTVLIA